MEASARRQAVEAFARRRASPAAAVARRATVLRVASAARRRRACPVASVAWAERLQVAAYFARRPAASRALSRRRAVRSRTVVSAGPTHRHCERSRARYRPASRRLYPSPPGPTPPRRPRAAPVAAAAAARPFPSICCRRDGATLTGCAAQLWSRRRRPVRTLQRRWPARPGRASFRAGVPRALPNRLSAVTSYMVSHAVCRLSLASNRFQPSCRSAKFVSVQYISALGSR